MAQSKVPIVFTRCMYGAVLIFLLWIVADQTYEVWKASRANAWPTTSGTILSSGAVRGCGKGSSYYPSVIYQYKVGSTMHESARITFGNVGCGSQSAAEIHASTYPAGTTVKVYVNPAAPDDSVLQTEVYQETWLAILFTSFVLLILAGVGIARYGSNSPFNYRSHSDARKSCARG